MLKIYSRLLLFFGYTSLFVSMPLILLGGGFWGFIAGIFFNVLFLRIISQKGKEKILQLLRAQPLGVESHPGISNMVDFYSAKLELQPPQLFLSPLPLTNLLSFGTSKRDSALIVSEQLLTSFSREELGAVICRTLTSIAIGQTQATTWLSYLLSFLERMPQGAFSTLITYSIAFLPIQLLTQIFSENYLDSISLDSSLSSASLLHALQKVHNQSRELSQLFPVSLAILFLVPPLKTESLSRVLWLPDDSKQRILKLKEFFYHS